MRKSLFCLVLVLLTLPVFAKAQKEEIIQPDELEKVIEQHPLVEKAEIYEVYYHSLLKVIYYKSRGEEPKCSYSFDLDFFNN